MVLSFLGVFGAFEEKAFSVVGNAERYDEIEEQDLKDFQDEHINADKKNKLAEAEELNRMLKTKQKQLKKLKDVDTSKEVSKEMEGLKKQLLNLPKRDRFKMELSGDYTYDTNISRLPLRQEKDDSLFDTTGTALFDLSGRKTDLRLELGGNRHWSWEFPEGDAWQGDFRLRYRRKYFRKLTQSSNSIISRNSSKSPEINEPKIRWDVNNQSAWNWAFSKKLSLNTGLAWTRRIFAQEAFDQDSGANYTFAPAGFWNITPKSRISMGVTFGGSRSVTKTGDSNSLNFNLGYLGRITRKSSANINFGYDKQTPKSADTAESTGLTLGAGYIWQLTSKTQTTIQAIRSLQNTTSDLVSGSPDDGEHEISKTDSHYYNDSLTWSLNSRLTNKFTANFSANISRNKTKAQTTVDEETETQQISFPLSLTINYVIRRWMILTLGYTFSYRVGNEENDFYRSHLYKASMRLTF